MVDPEDNLNFKLKRNQFNNRIPVQLIDMFDEFGDDKKYLLEYLIWLSCKQIGTKFAAMQEYEVAMLEKYFTAIKAQLGQHPQFGKEFETLFAVERDIEQKMRETLEQKAQEIESQGKDG